MNSTPWAHSLNETGKPEPLLEHLKLVAELCERFSSRFGCGSWGHCAGIWHDLGKFSKEFQAYIRGLNPGTVDHSTAGTQWAYRTAGDAGKLLAYVIAGHHGGLPDYHGELDARLTKVVPEWEKYAPKESLNIQPDQSLPFTPDKKDALFQLSFLTRMLYSALVDSDYLATEQFMDSHRSRQRETGARVEELTGVLEKHLAEISNDRTEVNRQRREILAHCVEASTWNPGLFSLTVPTGGGKTLASLMFALKHAVAHGMERVIVVVPYTSIIEQTAEIYREIFGEQSVLEHHSAVDFDDDTPIAIRLASENWDAPIIVTTSVQFFDSLFANRPSKCRKLHRIAKSVVILDEAQTLPVGMLAPCLAALRALPHYESSIVLCTATQPALSYRPDFLCGLCDVREIISCRGEHQNATWIETPTKLYEALRRVKVAYVGQLRDAELVERLSARRQVLCVVNTTRHAARLATAIQDAYHLSARMCPAHRVERLNEIRERLKAEDSCVVISTQVIEAGVDISFPVVYRAMSGLDSLAQSAGRCNREGLCEYGEVIVFEAEDESPPLGIRQSAAAARQVMPDHLADPLSLSAIDQFFRLYYWSRSDYDTQQIVPLLTDRGADRLQFQFRKAAEFSLIDSPTVPLIIPWGTDGAALVERLRRADATENPGLLRYLSRRIQRYSVNLWPAETKEMEAEGKVELIHGQFAVLSDGGMYSQPLGLLREG